MAETESWVWDLGPVLKTEPPINETGPSETRAYFEKLLMRKSLCSNYYPSNQLPHSR